MKERQLPIGWIIASIGGIADRITKGTTPTTLGFEYQERGVLFVKVESIENHRIRHDRCAYIDEAAHAALSRSQLAIDDILISIAGTLGRVGIVRSADVPGNTNQALAIIRTSGRINPGYLAYALETLLVKQAVAENGRGIGLQNLNLDQISRLPIVLSPLPEQQRIVEAIESYFSRIDEAVTTLVRVERNLKRYRASVLKAAVEGRLVPTEAALAKQAGRGYEPASVLLERIFAERRRRWSESGKKGKYLDPAPPDTRNLPDLPEGWCWASAESICEAVDSGTTPSREHFTDETGVPFIKVYNLTFDGSLDFTKQPTFVRSDYEGAKMRRSRVEPGDVLMNIVGPPLGKVSIAPPAHERWNINQAIVRFRPLPGLLGQFLSFFLQSEQCKRWLSATAKTTTSQVNLATTTCRRLALPVPPFVEQLRIVERVEEWITAASATRAQINASVSRAGRLRQSILRWAFEGRLADQDPGDDPASVLLERIKAERESAKPANASRSQRSAGKKQVRA